VAEENCFQGPFKTIKTVQISKVSKEKVEKWWVNRSQRVGRRCSSG